MQPHVHYELPAGVTMQKREQEPGAAVSFQPEPTQDQPKPVKGQHKHTQDQPKPTQDQPKPAQDQHKLTQNQHKQIQDQPTSIIGIKSWFTYEDELLDWQELTELAPEKRGLWPKQRLVGDAESKPTQAS